jgi:disulfide bond formation protein DsbB
MDPLTLFSTLTLIADIIIVLYLITLPFKSFRKLHSFIGKQSLWLAFMVALLATLGSLFFSEMLHWEPCRLCWFQRIFMYPLTLLFGIAAWKKDNGIWRYALPLAAIGGLFSIYQYYIQRFPPATEVCSITGVSCAAASFMYGYISIPVMALSVFVAVFLLGFSVWKK